MSKLTDGLLHDDWLIRHLMHSDPNRQIANDRVHLLLQGLAEVQNVGAGFHVDAEADGRLAIHPIEHPRRVHVTASDRDEITEAKETIVHAQIDRPQTLLGNELAPAPE